LLLFWVLLLVLLLSAVVFVFVGILLVLLCEGSVQQSLCAFVVRECDGDVDEVAAQTLHARPRLRKLGQQY
jgi:hypothetical protein